MQTATSRGIQSSPTTRFFLRMTLQLHIAIYRLSRGRLMGKNTIVITTIGRKSGTPRIRPLISGTDGDDYIIVASFGGQPKNPDWYGNLKANPEVIVEDHGKTAVTIARTVTDESEYQRLWTKMSTLFPSYDQYRQRTKRHIPIVVLTPKAH
jgi:deazaflavin-dependent oxidoreductase (nitroreductase family)